MSYKVMYKGLEVICDTFEDLDDLAEKAMSYQGAQKTPNPNNQSNSNGTPKSNGQPKEVVTKEPVTVEAFIKSLTPKTKVALRVLSENGNEMSDTEIRQKLGIESKQQLMGIISAIFKGAARVGIKVEDIFKRRPIFSASGEKDYASQIPANMLETYRNALKD